MLSAEKSSTRLYYDHYLDAGSFGNINLYKDNRNTVYAIKTPKKECCFNGNEQIKNEIRIMEKLNYKNNNNPYIIETFSVIGRGRHSTLVMSYNNQNIPLDYFIYDLNQQLSLNSMHCLIEAVRFLNSNDIVHRDINPSNILIDQVTLSPTLIDFGLAEECNQEVKKTNSRGTRRYLPPESKRGVIWKNKTDLICLAYVFYEAITQERFLSLKPKSFYPEFALRYYIYQGCRLRSLGFTKKTNKKTAFMIETMLTYDPEKRPSASEILKTFFSDIRSEQVIGDNTNTQSAI